MLLLSFIIYSFFSKRKRSVSVPRAFVNYYPLRRGAPANITWDSKGSQLLDPFKGDVAPMPGL